MHRKANDNHNASWLDGTSQFQATDWTQVQKSGFSKVVMGEIYLKYRKPVFLYLRGRGFKDDQAREIIQDFFTDKVLGQQLFHKANRSKGKFRSFLLAAIRNYAIDRHRTARPMQQLDSDQDNLTHEGDPSTAFNRAWAAQVLEQALNELDSECRMHGKQTHWNLFRLWLVEPDLSSDKCDMASLCKKLGIDDTNKAYSMISNMKGRFKTILRRCLQRNVSSESQVDEEIQSLLNVFCR